MQHVNADCGRYRGASFKGGRRCRTSLCVASGTWRDFIGRLSGLSDANLGTEVLGGRNGRGPWRWTCIVPTVPHLVSQLLEPVKVEGWNACCKITFKLEIFGKLLKKICTIAAITEHWRSIQPIAFSASQYPCSAPTTAHYRTRDWWILPSSGISSPSATHSHYSCMKLLPARNRRVGVCCLDLPAELPLPSHLCASRDSKRSNDRTEARESAAGGWATIQKMGGYLHH